MSFLHKIKILALPLLSPLFFTGCASLNKVQYDQTNKPFILINKRRKIYLGEINANQKYQKLFDAIRRPSNEENQIEIVELIKNLYPKLEIVHIFFSGNFPNLPLKSQKVYVNVKEGKVVKAGEKPEITFLGFHHGEICAFEDICPFLADQKYNNDLYSEIITKLLSDKAKDPDFLYHVLDLLSQQPEVLEYLEAIDPIDPINGRRIMFIRCKSGGVDAKTQAFALTAKHEGEHEGENKYSLRLFLYEPNK